jgi:hypothetical protein
MPFSGPSRRLSGGSYLDWRSSFGATCHNKEIFEAGKKAMRTANKAKADAASAAKVAKVLAEKERFTSRTKVEVENKAKRARGASGSAE